jgi:hypothetical protein
MSTADGREDSGLVRADGSVWGRREFVAAMGTGAILGATGCEQLLAFRRDTVTFLIEGALLYAPNFSTKSLELLMPLAESADPPKPHYDTSAANPLYAYMAAFKEYSQGEKPITNTETHLLGGDLTIDLGVGPGPLRPDFHRIPSMEKIADRPTKMDFNTGTHACRVTLKGGWYTPLPETPTGSWHFARNLNRAAPREAELAYGMTWETRASTVLVKVAGGSDITFEAAKHPVVVIGHHPDKPDQWTMKHPDATLGDVDQDFKWVYRILNPREGTWQEALSEWDGMPGQLLPAPVMASGPYVGSPNCFGGCFGC